MIKALVLPLSLLICVAAESGPNHPAKTVKEASWPDVAVTACGRGLSSFSWGFNTSSKGYPALCSYEPAFESMAYCANNFLANKGLSKDFLLIIESFNTLCSYYVDVPPSFTDETLWSALENGTSHIQTSFNVSAINYAPVAANATYVNNYATAYYAFLNNIDKSNMYGAAICLYFLGIFVLAAAINFLRINGFHKPLLKKGFVNYFRSHITIPAVYHRHAQEFSYFKVITGLIPTRLEAILVVGYVILHTVLIAVDYGFDSPNLLFSPKKAQIARFVADRTGIMAFAHFPLIVLFATRNNFFQWITGLHYTTFIVFHKWVSRMMFLDAVIHGAAYTHYTIIYKTWKESREEIYWEFGVAAIIFAGLMILYAFYFFRKNYYEAFLYTHILFGALFFYSCWEHVCQLGWTEWLYAAIALWTVDRIVRVLRIVAFGFPEATFRLLEDDLVRLSIPKVSKIWRAKPGQYAFIYFWHPRYFWQSHPFTVMDSILNENEVIIVFKPKEGLTRYLKNQVKKSGGTMKMRVSLEGPYGCGSSLQHYDNVLLLVGGAGLPGPLCHAVKLAGKYSEQGKKINLVLSMRGPSVLNAFSPEFEKLAEFGVNVELYDTSLSSLDAPCRDQASDAVESDKEEEKVQTNQVSSPCGNIEFTAVAGRPPLDVILERAVNGSSSLAVFCCGPSSLVDTARNLTACYVRKYPTKPIEYFEDYQSW
ncbi:LANO_0A00298g1_1 [Lachancea nothofagi CBS 11611]|uniref:ferric-chelate reductase (NADPH) n=1 Tax=Lachancea nothofagi CBS 11611 TaxID=1266666 RepID=A0A1G4ILL9_9SACH|nr:LANO_0A00298g1_1 [Lachancea nothofagi CBS 11611]